MRPPPVQCVRLVRVADGWTVIVDRGSRIDPTLGPFADLWEAAHIAAALEPAAIDDTPVADAVTPGRTPRFG